MGGWISPPDLDSWASSQGLFGPFRRSVSLLDLTVCPPELVGSAPLETQYVVS